MYPPVLSKIDMYRRWEAGEFGNRSLTWNSLQDFLDSGFEGKVGVRYVVPNHPIFNPFLTSSEVVPYLEKAKQAGVSFDLDGIRISAAIVEKCTLQGEVVEDPYQTYPLSLTYRLYDQRANRDAVKDGKFVTGASANALLRMYMDAESYEWFHTLLERYPYHAIEFSCFERCVGLIPNRNTIFWEVRKY